MTRAEHVSASVLNFYRQLPFNYYSSSDKQAASIRKNNSIESRVVLQPLLTPNLRVLDVGCGAGWLSNSMGYYYEVDATGIDFNPVAIDRARRTAALLDSQAKFLQADLFIVLRAQYC